ncbi:MAG: ABC transporter ATP-binding protein [Microthrixaceae bacterium]
MTLSAEVGLTLGRLDLRVEVGAGDGEVVAVLGPNGAGKTTLLRALAGLEGLDVGRITLDGTVVDEPDTATFVPAERRPVGMVVQDLLLFPHLDALGNIAFGPRARGVPRRTAETTARSWLERVGLGERARARPAELSGGQAQRVALARALATDPRLLLLDEPLAALDATTRPEVRRDLRRHLDDFGGTTVLVTHDPLDALALADRVVVVEAGRVTQAGTLTEVTTRPRTPYVADLIGVNLLRGEAHGTGVRLEGDGGAISIAERRSGPTLLLVRPQAVALHRSEPDTSARNRWDCTVEGFDLLGEHVRVRLSGGIRLVADLTPASVAEMGLTEGSRVWASVKATDVVAYDG